MQSILSFLGDGLFSEYFWGKKQKQEHELTLLTVCVCVFEADSRSVILLTGVIH